MYMHRTRAALMGAMALYAVGHPTADASGKNPPVRAATAAVASDQPTAALPRELRLFVGDSRVIDARTERVAVGNGKVVSVSPVGGSQLVLIGHAPGNTVVQMWMRGGGMHRIAVSVAGSDLASTLSVVEGLLQGVQGVQARLRGDRVVLEGDAADARARDRAAAVAGLFPGVVLDFVEIEPGNFNFIFMPEDAAAKRPAKACGSGGCSGCSASRANCAGSRATCPSTSAVS